MNLVYDVQKELEKGELAFWEIASKYGITFMDVCSIKQEMDNQGFYDVGGMTYDEVRFNSRGD